MLVSIVIPNLNKAPFLEETLKSLFAQEYTKLEIIVVDGGSTDGSKEIFERYRDRFAHYITEPDQGQADAVNKGFALARGELIAWLNSDDIYFPWTVRRAVERFRVHSELSLLYGDCVFIDGESRFLRYFVEVEPFDEYRLRNCSDFIMQPTTFFRRTVWEAVGGLDTALHYAFDYEFWCRLARSGRTMEYVPEIMAANRVYDETKTSAGGNARMREIKEVYSRHKTGWWPHGYWNFWRAELRHRRRQTTDAYKRFKYLVFAYGAMWLGYKNCFHALRHPRQAQGFIGSEGDCLARAHLCLPVKFGDRALRIKVTASSAWLAGRSGPAVHFALEYSDIPQVTFGFAANQPEVIVEIPLTNAIRTRGALIVNIKFESADGSESTGNSVVGRIQVLPPRTVEK